MIKKEETYPIGHISKPHGLKGEVLFCFDDDIFDRVDCPYLIIEIDGILVPFFLEEYRFKSDSTALLKFEDIDTAEKAQPILGSTVYFENKYIEEGDVEDVSLSYFIGFTIKDPKGNAIGIIRSIDNQTENWLFVVEPIRAQTEQEMIGMAKGQDYVLIPAHEDFITDINHKAKMIEMDLPSGLLEL